jgi:DNA/RNA endonuclease G (NUC1)
VVNQPIDFELYKAMNESSWDNFEKYKREWKSQVEFEIYIKRTRTRFIGEKPEEDPISQLQMITQVIVNNKLIDY